jgi:hypothetical protein
MSLQVVAKTDPPETEGSDGGGEYGSWDCEECGHSEFRLQVWRGAPLVVCVECSKPQDAVIWIGAGDE